MTAHLVESVKVVRAKAHEAANTTGVESDIVDTEGFDGVMFLTTFGTGAANNTLKAQSSLINDSGGMADITGVASGSTLNKNEVMLDVHRPPRRYVRVVAARGTSSTLETIYALLYRARDLPTTQAATAVVVKKVDPESA